MAKDFYQILGLSRNASQDDIKNAYRKLARKWHPDINPGNSEAEQKFKDISQAYQCLSNKEQKKLYDEFGEDGLKSGFDAEKARKYEQWSSFDRAGSQEPDQGFGHYQSYEDLFGNLFDFDTQGGMSYKTTRATKGRNIEHGITIDLISALKGFKTDLSLQIMKQCSYCTGRGKDPQSQITICKTCAGSGHINVAQGPMKFTRTCPTCQGRGNSGRVCTQCNGTGSVMGLEKITVTIPKGVKEGTKVRIPGKGEPGSNGRPGDLYLITHIKEHPLLQRKGDNLHMEVPVTVREAMVGGNITIPTIDGSVNLKIPPNSQSGQVLKLKGRGAFNSKTKRKGDLLVKLIVKIPKTKDKEILDAVKKMDKFYEKDPRGDMSL